MVLKKSKLLSKQIFLIIILLKANLCSSQEKSQIDSIKCELFTNKLQHVGVSKIKLNNSPTVLITLMNCSGCVSYFTSHKKSFNFIFEIENKSILEINRIITLYNLKDFKNVLFFVANKSLKHTNALIKEPSPQIIFVKNQMFFHLNYSHVVEITKDFTIKPKKLKSCIKNSKANPIIIPE